MTHSKLFFSNQEGPFRSNAFTQALTNVWFESLVFYTMMMTNDDVDDNLVMVMMMIRVMMMDEG
jgi:hypothetical protein